MLLLGLTILMFNPTSIWLLGVADGSIFLALTTEALYAFITD